MRHLFLDFRGTVGLVNGGTKDKSANSNRGSERDQEFKNVAILNSWTHSLLLIPKSASQAQQHHLKQVPKPTSHHSALTPLIMCDDLTSCLCGALCCMCCVSATDSDNRSRHRRECYGRHAPVYVQPVVVTTVPMNGKAHHGHQRHPNGYYYVQHTHHGKYRR